MVCDYNDRGKVFFIWHMIIHSGEKAFPCIISMYECKKGHAVILYNIFMNPKVRLLRTMIYFYWAKPQTANLTTGFSKYVEPPNFLL